MLATPAKKHPLSRRLVLAFGWMLGALGFLFSLALALTMLIRQGSPAFLLIWTVAVLATAACVRAQLRWRKSLERMYSEKNRRTLYPARRGWRQDVEDISFRDIPNGAMSFVQ